MENNQIKMFAQRLADNHKSTRDKALKMLRKHFKIRSSMGECFEMDDMLNIWKGLFYSMYMSDKSLTQEALAEDISLLIHQLQNNADKRCFIQAAFQTFAREWHGIDVFRVDKMMMFVRRILRQALNFVKRLNWAMEEATSVVKILEDSVMCPSDNVNSKPLGLKLHLCDIYLEELAKVGGENLNHNIILCFLQPYIKVLALSTLECYIWRVNERVMKHLMRQSDLGILEGEGMLDNEELSFEVEDDYCESREEKEDETMEESSATSPMEEDESVLDPRAGAVDVCLPQLSPDYNGLAEALQSMGSLSNIKQQKRNLLYKLAGQFRDLEGGVYPLAVQEKMDSEPINMHKERDRAVVRMQNFEKKLRNKYDIGKKRKRQNNVSIGVSRNEEGNDFDDEVKAIELQPPKRKKMKNSRKVKNNSSHQETKSSLKKQKKNLLKSVEEKIKNIGDDAGIPYIKGKGMNTSSHKMDTSMQFEVSDLKNSSEVKKRKGSSQSLKKMKRNSFKVSEISSTEDDSHSENEPIKKQRKCNPSSNTENMNSVASNDTNTGIVLNFSTKKHHQLGLEKDHSKFPSPWDEPLKEGEIEYVVKSRKLINKEKKSRKVLKNKKKKNVQKTSGRNRALSFNLKENKEHPFNDYTRTVKNSPSIPFSAEKRPKVSVLKPSPSPILIHKPLLKTLKSIPTVSMSASPKLKKIKRLSNQTCTGFI